MILFNFDVFTVPLKFMQANSAESIKSVNGMKKTCSSIA